MEFRVHPNIWRSPSVLAIHANYHDANKKGEKKDDRMQNSRYTFNTFQINFLELLINTIKEILK